MLLRLVYLTITNLFGALRLLPVSDRDKVTEILALRHQLTVLERQLGADRVKLAPEDRVFLAALLGPLPRKVLRRLRLLIQPDTVLHWHRDLMKRRHARTCPTKKPGRPPTVHSIRRLVLRLVRENPSWGYRRVHGELATLGIKVAASTVWEILTSEGIDPAPDRAATTWANFLRSQADALMACDFIETVTLTGQRQYILAVIEHATRRIRTLGTTAHPTAARASQAARNPAMDLTDAQTTHAYLTRDQDAKYSAHFDEILRTAGIEVVHTGVRIPRMNAIMERRVQTCRHELLDRTLIWNERHLRHTLRQFESHYNLHRPHQALQQAAPLHAVPEPLIHTQTTRLKVRRRDRLGGILHEYQHAS
ncbi:integrase core domain-containing protein [Streptomyces sp. NPDC102384]|uniref:integrase core domain-containing protein n=1 Tax=Streptomyces sp. NPDC102384 TaxID=3366166 RepID=UPI003820C449